MQYPRTCTLGVYSNRAADNVVCFIVLKSSESVKSVDIEQISMLWASASEIVRSPTVDNAENGTLFSKIFGESHAPPFCYEKAGRGLTPLRAPRFAEEVQYITRTT